MDPRRFSPVVLIRPPRSFAARLVVVGSAWQAGQVLLAWPGKAKRRRPYRAALQAVLCALGGEGNAEAARAAFLAAAHDAGLLVEQDVDSIGAPPERRRWGG